MLTGYFACSIIIITIPMQEKKLLQMIQNIIQLLYGSGLEDIYDKENWVAD